MDTTTIGFDPACGARVREEDAVKLEVRGEIRWFCSDACATRFAATPWRFEDEEYHDRQPEAAPAPLVIDVF